MSETIPRPLKPTPGDGPDLTPRPEVRLTMSGYHDIQQTDEFKSGNWRDEARCVDVCARWPDRYNPEEWFPVMVRGRGGAGRKKEPPPKIKQVCLACNVRLECLVYALSTNQPEGIWAAHTAYTLEKLRRRIR